MKISREEVRFPKVSLAVETQGTAFCPKENNLLIKDQVQGALPNRILRHSNQMQSWLKCESISGYIQNKNPKLLIKNIIRLVKSIRKRKAISINFTMLFQEDNMIFKAKKPHMAETRLLPSPKIAGEQTLQWRIHQEEEQEGDLEMRQGRRQEEGPNRKVTILFRLRIRMSTSESKDPCGLVRTLKLACLLAKFENQSIIYFRIYYQHMNRTFNFLFYL